MQTLNSIPCDKQGFLQQGFARFDAIIDECELALLSDIYDQLFEDPTRHPGYINLGGVNEEGVLQMPQIGMPSHINSSLQSLQCFERLSNLAQDLLGPTCAFRNDHMILKPVGIERDTPWHQDQSYHSPLYRYKNVNFWMPLDDVDIDDGCLWFVPQTHRGTVVPHENNFHAGGATATSATNQDYWMANGVAVPCPRGSVTAHHSYCMHYAAPNKGHKPRRAWINVFACPPLALDQPLSLPWQDER